MNCSFWLAWLLTSSGHPLLSGSMEGGDSDEVIKAMRRKASLLQHQIDALQKELALNLRWLADIEALKADKLPRPGYSGKRGGKPLPPGVSKNWAQVGEGILKDQGRPMTPLEMTPYVDQYRSTAGETKVSWRLSNNLRQKPDVFERVTWRGMTRWWLKGVPLPPE